MMSIVLNDVVSSNNTSVINSNFTKIEDAINDDLLKREVEVGEANEMRTHLDMNSNRVTNVADGSNPQDVATVSQLEDATPVKGVDYFDGEDGADGATGPKGDTGDTGATGAAGADGADGVDGEGQVVTIVAGTNISVDATDPANPIVSSTAGGGSPLTTKGDLYTYDTGDQRLPVGADGQVLTVDSAETTGIKWDTPSGGSTYMLVSHEEASGVNGDTTTGTTTRESRTLNTEKFNSISGASLSANQVTLPAGTYKVDGVSSMWSTFASGSEQGARIYFYNVTDAAEAVVGVPSMALNDAGERSGTTLVMAGIITIASPKVFDLQSYRPSANGSGLLFMYPVSEVGVNEVYSTITIEKIG